MSKLSLTMTSLIGAIPALGLSVLLIMTFVTGEYANKVTGNIPLLILVIMTLTVSVLVALLPAGVLIFAGGSKTDVSEVGVDDDEDDEDDEDDADDDAFDDDVEDVFAEDDDDEGGDDEEPFAESDADLEIEGLDEEDIFSVDDDDDPFGFDDE